MIKQRDLVIGAITGYTFDQIAPWVNSLDRSGFTGIKAVLAYNIDHRTADELTKRGYSILAFQQDEKTKDLIYLKQNFSIVVERFLHYYFFLNTPENKSLIRYIVATDVKDVIFQSNPSVWLDQRDASKETTEIIASSEGIAYEHEPWGANNLRTAFGQGMYDRHKTMIINNAGVIAGKFDAFLGLCKTVYFVSASTMAFVPGGGGPDQAALNLVLSTPSYMGDTQFTNHWGTWAAQLGTMMDPRKLPTYSPSIQEPLPAFDESRGLVVNHVGNPYTIVHQWDRVPNVRAAVERMYL